MPIMARQVPLQGQVLHQVLVREQIGRAPPSFRASEARPPELQIVYILNVNSLNFLHFFTLLLGLRLLRHPGRDLSPKLTS